MAPSFDEIVAQYEQRKKTAGPWQQITRRVRDMVNGDLVVPLPQLDKSEESFVANLAQQGLDQLSQRVGSVLPNLWYPAMRPGIKKSEELARTRRLVNLGWWGHNRMGLQLRQRARYFLGYSRAPVVIRPNFKTGMPVWQLRDPLGCYPSQCDDPNDLTPDDSIFTFTRRLDWLQDNYPDAYLRLDKGRDPKPDDLVEVLEYVDDEVLVLGVLSKRPDRTTSGYYGDQQSAGVKQTELERLPNRTGMCLAVIPSRITLDRPAGQFDGTIGMYNMQARLMALEVIAAEKGIFPDQWFVSNDGQGEVVTVANGLTGDLGEIRNGDIKPIQIQPGFAALQTIDRLAAAQRETAGIPSELQGLAASNVRTGRRGSQLMDAAVSFPVQEAQDIFAQSLQEEDIRAAAVDKNWLNRQKTFYVNWRGAEGRVDYKPSDIWECFDNVVSYAFAGADINELMVQLGQAVGAEIVSKETAMELHPFVADPGAEFERITAEAIHAALLQSVQTQAADPNGPYQPIDLANIVEQVLTGKKPLYEAIQEAHDKQQKAQAAASPAPVDPSQMPGLSQPGAPGTPPTIAPSTPSIHDLAGQLRDLHRVSQPV